MCPLDMTPIRRRGVVAAASNASSPSVTIEALHHHTLSAKHQHIGTNFLFFISSRRLHTGYWRDWSSDLCSSDLRDDVVLAVDEHEERVLARLDPAAQPPGDAGEDVLLAPPEQLELRVAVEQVALLVAAGDEPVGEIGRASCREIV